jgi:hypothetical protein
MAVLRVTSRNRRAIAMNAAIGSSEPTSCVGLGPPTRGTLRQQLVAIAVYLATARPGHDERAWQRTLRASKEAE